MKTTLLVLSVVCVLFSVLTNVSSLQCYRCDDCAQIKEEYLITCGSNSTSSTVAPTTTTITTTMSPTTTTTVSPNTTTTVAPNTTTTVSLNTTTTVAPNNTTTVAPNTTTTVSPNGTTTAAPNTTTTISSNTTTDTSTEATINNTTNTTTTAPDNRASRVRRAAGKYNNCICKNGNCDCSGKYILQTRADINTTTVTYVCVKDTYTVNGTSHTRRGCAVKYNQTTTTCQNALFSENCNICEKDKCNGSVTLRFSAVVVFLSLMSYALL